MKPLENKFLCGIWNSFVFAIYSWIVAKFSDGLCEANMRMPTKIRGPMGKASQFFFSLLKCPKTKS